MCPYDAELYGHWWYEGPDFLYTLAKKIFYDKCDFKLITPGEYIEKYPEMQLANPCRSSWGAKGYSYVWLNPSNDYIHRHLHKAGDRMCDLAEMYPNEAKYSIKRRILNQCARELVLAQSSDWLFIITHGTMVDYAKKRVKDHIGRFTKFYLWLTEDEDLIKNNRLSEDKEIFLKQVEEKDPIFPEIDYMVYN